MEESKLTIKSTDLIIIRVGKKDPGSIYYREMDEALYIATVITGDTGALVLVLEQGTTIEQLPEEEARKLYQGLRERFEESPESGYEERVEVDEDGNVVPKQPRG